MSKKTVTKETFGQRLRRVRIEKGLSQLQVAEKAGIHNTHLSRYEKDGSRPNGSTLMRLADALGVTADFLMDGPTDSLAADRLNDIELLRLFEQMDRLPDDKKEHVKFLLASVIRNHQLEEALLIARKVA